MRWFVEPDTLAILAYATPRSTGCSVVLIRPTPLIDSRIADFARVDGIELVRLITPLINEAVAVEDSARHTDLPIAAGYRARRQPKTEVPPRLTHPILAGVALGAEITIVTGLTVWHRSPRMLAVGRMAIPAARGRRVANAKVALVDEATARSEIMLAMARAVAGVVRAVFPIVALVVADTRGCRSVGVGVLAIPPVGIHCLVDVTVEENGILDITVFDVAVGAGVRVRIGVASRDVGVRRTLPRRQQQGAARRDGREAHHHDHDEDTAHHDERIA